MLPNRNEVKAKILESRDNEARGLFNEAIVALSQRIKEGEIIGSYTAKGKDIVLDQLKALFTKEKLKVIDKPCEEGIDVNLIPINYYAYLEEHFKHDEILQIKKTRQELIDKVMLEIRDKIAKVIKEMEFSFEVPINMDNFELGALHKQEVEGIQRELEELGYECEVQSITGSAFSHKLVVRL